MNTDFAELTALHQEWQSLQPLKPEHEARLWKKLRMEWNYHSNHIEGNTLTYGETELLLIHDRTHGDHTHREYLEMKAHDLGIEHVRSLAADTSRVLTEGDIRDLNQIILKEPFWKAAQTSDGQPSRKEIIPGQYKTSPNHVRTATGELFTYASVEDTPPRMAALAAWLREHLERTTLPPVAIAAKLHHDFVVIHPFDDGNGRVARLLVNYVLMRFGYLPLIVPTKEKATYINALGLADAGDLMPLTDYLAGLTAKSLSLGIKAAKGEPIEEPNDVEKELEIFIRQQQGYQERVIQRSRESIQNIYQLGIKPLLGILDAKLKKLEPLFASHQMTFHPGELNGQNSVNLAFNQILREAQHSQQFLLQHHFAGYRGQAADPFNLDVAFEIRFEDFQYQISTDNRLITKKLYSEPVMADEAEQIATGILAAAFDQIKKRSQQKA